MSDPGSGVLRPPALAAQPRRWWPRTRGERSRGLPSARAAVVVTAATLALVLAARATIDPNLDRTAFAVLVGANLALVAARWPRAAVVAITLFLPLLELLRRLLIPVGDWTSFDPLLLVGLVTAAVIVAGLLRQGRLAVEDTLSRLVLALLALSCLEVANPQGGGLVQSVSGLFFFGGPLVWYFIGQSIVDRRLLALLLATVTVLGLSIALYGIEQSFYGLPSWDAQWVTLAGYAALSVGGVTRAFGTFASSAEYAAYLGGALLLAVLWLAHGRVLALLAVPPLAVAEFVASARGVVVLTVLALLILAGLRTGSGRVALAVVLTGTVAAVGANHFLGESLAASAEASGNPLLVHQVGGLTDPLDPEQSTALGHWQLVVDGLLLSLQHPLGLGTAVTKPADETVGQGTVSANTEIDIANAFVAFGPVGGALFVAVIVITLRRVGGLCLRTHQFGALAVMGFLVVTLGEWLNGRYYALSPLIWLLIGWSNGAWLDWRARSDPAVDGVDSGSARRAGEVLVPV